MRVRLLFMLGIAAMPLAPACENHHPIAPLRDGLAACEELEKYCELPGAELGEPYQTCYETGDNGNGNACLDTYYDCVPKCKAALDELEAEGGAGGEGGGAGESSGAGGQGGA
jgi:hypothetical protein